MTKRQDKPQFKSSGKSLVNRRASFVVGIAAAFVLCAGALCWITMHLIEQEIASVAPGQMQTAAPQDERVERPESTNSAESAEVMSADESTANAQDRVAAELASAPARLPLQLAGCAQVNEYQRTDTLESWRLLSNETCADFALLVLNALQEQEVELVQAGFMDISGESWGCVYIDSNGESLSVTLMPQSPFSPRSNSNVLAVTVIHYLQKGEL